MAATLEGPRISVTRPGGARVGVPTQRHRDRSAPGAEREVRSVTSQVPGSTVSAKGPPPGRGVGGGPSAGRPTPYGHRRPGRHAPRVQANTSTGCSRRSFHVLVLVGYARVVYGTPLP